jgi:hypothetical protein
LLQSCGVAVPASFAPNTCWLLCISTTTLTRSNHCTN